MIHNSLPPKYFPNLENQSKTDRALIESAYLFAKAKHRGEKRKSGSAYILHPLRVAKMLSTDSNDPPIIAAGLLHDVLENTDTSNQELVEKFGSTIAGIVEGVTKVSALKLKDKNKIFSDNEIFLKQVDNYRKLLFAAASDPRVMIVKLYDRLDNARTLKWLPKEKQKFYARETIEIFAPIAERLGMGFLKGSLEDFAFPFAYPDEYAEFKKKIKNLYNDPHNAVQMVIPEIKAALSQAQIPTRSLEGRAKFQYSLYKKIKRKGDLTQIHDLIALRVITDSIENCYKTLGLVHSLYEPLPGQIDDYIAKPKENGYQSIHTTVKNGENIIFEIQIRTEQMHQFAEHGVAAHWNYKEKSKNKKTIVDASTLEWLEALNQLKKVKNRGEFLQNLKEQLFSDRIFVFTPKGAIIKLPAGSTPVDFAYHIHTDLGSKTVGAKINGRIMPLSITLNTSDIVEIITGKISKPSTDWLNFVKTTHARQKIKAALKQKELDSFVTQGLKKLIAAINQYNLPQLNKSEAEKLIKNSRLPYQSLDKSLAAFGENKISSTRLLKTIFPGFRQENLRKVVRKNEGKQEIVSLKNIPHQFAKCCKPNKTDKVIGYVTKERVIKVHKTECKRLELLPKERMINL